MNKKQTVLIVDDIANNINIAANALMKENINVIVAQSGKEALKSINKIRPDLILLDIMMPEMSGYDVCKILKDDEQTKNIPIIFLTALNETKDIVKGFKLGAVDYINKPFISEELISRVNSQLKIHKQYKKIIEKETLIKENNAKLSAVINSIPDFIFYKNKESKYTGLNKAYAKFLGEKPENIIGNTDYEFFNQKNAKTFLNSDKNIINTGEDFLFEEWTQDFDGNEIYLNTRKTPLINSEGNIFGVVGVSRNLTKLKITENELKEKQEKLNLIYDNANEGIFILQNNKIVFNNKKLCEITGFNKKELQKRFFLEFVHKKDQKEVADFYQRKIKGKKIGHAVVFRIIDFSKNIKYVKVNTKQITWEFGDAILGILDDITEQFLLQKELKESRERLRLSQKAGKIGALEWTFKDDKIICSEIAYKLFGISKKTPFLNTKELLSYIHNDDVERIITEFQTNTKKLEKEHKAIYRIIKENGECCWIEEISEMYYDKEEKPCKMIGVIQDITIRKKVENEIKQKNAEIKCNRDEILSSIRYAQTIQKSILTTQENIDKILKNNFIIFKPKDIVSGDFYYVNEFQENIIFTVADCTGHGVPGGFITMLGIQSIHGILKEKNINTPSKVLNNLRKRIKDIFKVSGNENYNGIDIAFCSINKKTNILQYSGAFNPLWIVRNNELIEIKATRNPIGFFPIEKEFENHEFQLQNNDKLYLFSDGFKDQIGGKDLKKYNNRPFKDLILNTSNFPINEQKDILLNELKNWQKDLVQIDDITIMGIEWKIN